MKVRLGTETKLRLKIADVTEKHFINTTQNEHKASSWVNAGHNSCEEVVEKHGNFHAFCTSTLCCMSSWTFWKLSSLMITTNVLTRKGSNTSLRKTEVDLQEVTNAKKVRFK